MFHARYRSPASSSDASRGADNRPEVATRGRQGGTAGSAKRRIPRAAGLPKRDALSQILQQLYLKINSFEQRLATRSSYIRRRKPHRHLHNSCIAHVAFGAFGTRLHIGHTHRGPAACLASAGADCAAKESNASHTAVNSLTLLAQALRDESSCAL
jgi:hypothetical protein